MLIYLSLYLLEALYSKIQIDDDDDDDNDDDDDDDNGRRVGRRPGDVASCFTSAEKVILHHSLAIYCY